MDSRRHLAARNGKRFAAILLVLALGLTVPYMAYGGPAASAFAVLALGLLLPGLILSVTLVTLIPVSWRSGVKRATSLALSVAASYLGAVLVAGLVGPGRNDLGAVISPASPSAAGGLVFVAIVAGLAFGALAVLPGRPGIAGEP